jgi:hypothetical protein
MLAIGVDGRFALPPGKDRDFTQFLERHSVMCVGVGQIRAPFDPANVQKLYLEWVKRQQRRIRRRLVMAPIAVAVLLTTFYHLLSTPGCDQRQSPDLMMHASLPSDDRPRIPLSVDEIIKKLNLANIAYNTPSSMHCDEKTKIRLLLSPRATIEELRARITGLGDKVGESIRVADVMEAQLYSGAFETHALRPERQAISASDDTEWMWEITAKEPGKQQISLTISAVLDVNGREASRVIRVYERSINVRVTMSRVVGTFVANHWQWLFGLMVAGGAFSVTWCIGWWRTREDRGFLRAIASEVLVGKIKVLFFAANPRGTDPLDLNREFREIDQEVRFGEYRDALELVIVPGTRLIDLLRKLNEVHPNIVHFSGHGNIDEEIILESGQGDQAISKTERRSVVRDMRRSEPEDHAGGSGSPMPLTKSALVDVLEACNEETIRVVVFNACHTRPQAEALSEVIDCVISMNRVITDVGAIKFAASFYGALAFGRSVRTAFDQGVARLKAEGISECETPELIVHAGVDPSALVLVGPRGRPKLKQRVTKQGM